MKTVSFYGPAKLNKEQKKTVATALSQAIEQAINEGFEVFRASIVGDKNSIVFSIISQLKKQNKRIILEAILPYSEILNTENKKRQNIFESCNSISAVQKNKNCLWISNLIIDLVENSDRLITVWNGKKNNIYHAIEYAKLCEKDVKTIYI